MHMLTVSTAEQRAEHNTLRVTDFTEFGRGILALKLYGVFDAEMSGGDLG